MFISNRDHLSPPRSFGDAAASLAIRKGAARICTLTLLTADVVAFAVAGFLAFAIEAASQYSPYRRAIYNMAAQGLSWHGWASLLVAVALLSYFASRGHYTSRVPSWNQMGDALLGTWIALGCDIFLTLIVYDTPINTESLFRWALLGPSILISRAVARRVLNMAGVWTLSTIIIAPSRRIGSVRAALTSDPTLGYSVVGSIAPEVAATLSEEALLNMVEQRDAAFVVLAIGGESTEIGQRLIDILRRSGLPIALLPVLQGLPVVGFRQHYFLGHDIVMLVNRNNLARPFSRMLKALFDQVIAAVMLILLAPLMVTITALVRIAGGPALYRHRRIGAGGRHFDCFKFRSMVPDAGQVLEHALANDPVLAEEWAATQKLRDDPRVTGIGRFLRRSSLDELPQLLNVVRGEMSLVGPRPIVADEVKRYGDDIEFYYAAKPGITGLWQISGRNDVSYAQRVKLDVWYVRNWTLWHDVTILLRTIPAVFLQRGAR